MWQGSEYGRVLNMQELHRVANMPKMAEHVGVGCGYPWIYLNLQ